MSLRTRKGEAVSTYEASFIEYVPMRLFQCSNYHFHPFSIVKIMIKFI